MLFKRQNGGFVMSIPLFYLCDFPENFTHGSNSVEVSVFWLLTICHHHVLFIGDPFSTLKAVCAFLINCLCHFVSIFLKVFCPQVISRAFHTASDSPDTTSSLPCGCQLERQSAQHPLQTTPRRICKVNRGSAVPNIAKCTGMAHIYPTGWVTEWGGPGGGAWGVVLSEDKTQSNMTYLGYVGHEWQTRWTGYNYIHPDLKLLCLLSHLTVISLHSYHLQQTIKSNFPTVHTPAFDQVEQVKNWSCHLWGDSK